MKPQLIITVLNAAIAFLEAMVILGFQIHTYRNTRHRSSLILLSASIVGIACYLLMNLPWLAPRPMFSATPFLLLVSAVLLAQAVLSVWGSAELFIITAAAADKTSFGCADDRDLTYFGEAFYRDALPRATSLEIAFQQAKLAIAEREKLEQQTPSDPQAYFGSELGPALAQFDATSFDRNGHAQRTR